jgi:hypothetical protein
MWLQGLQNAPYVVKKCYESWIKHNPNWEITFLHEENLEEYLKLDDIIANNKHALSKEALADIVRINLLATYGGVWADSTCFCCIPLDDWLREYTQSGFFAFDRPGRDRLISSWFLASRKECYLTVRYCEVVNSYWRDNCLSSTRHARIVKLLTAVLNRNPSLTRLWFSVVVRKILKIYPYYWFHYLFARLVREDRLFKQIWTTTPKYSADGPHQLQFFGLLKPVSEQIKLQIDTKKEPLYKLTYKYNQDITEDCTLSYLLDSV